MHLPEGVCRLLWLRVADKRQDGFHQENHVDKISRKGKLNEEKPLENDQESGRKCHPGHLCPGNRGALSHL